MRGSLTMAAKKKKQKLNSGQSVLEFALILPLYLTLISYLVQATVAQNGAIVNQKYSRLRLMEMTRNHADYPFLSTTTAGAGRQTGWQRLWIGIDRNTWDISERDPEDRHPKSPSVSAGILGPLTNDGEDGDITFPAEQRRSIRIRIMSFICLPPKFVPASQIQGGAQSIPYLTDYLRNETFRDGNFRFCSSATTD